jgi:hypothetical protein
LNSSRKQQLNIKTLFDEVCHDRSVFLYGIFFSQRQRIFAELIVKLGVAGELLQRYPKARVTAVDYSELSVEKAKEYNREMIAAGRYTLHWIWK